MNNFGTTIQNLLNKVSSDDGLEVTIALDTEVYVKLFATITLSVIIATAVSIIFKNIFKGS